MFAGIGKTYSAIHRLSDASKRAWKSNLIHMACGQGEKILALDELGTEVQSLRQGLLRMEGMRDQAELSAARLRTR